MLETRNSEFRLVEKRQQELEEEIAAARELSAMHDRLRVELEETRKQRDDIEHMVMSLKERAERAEKALEEDRVRLNDERTSLERSVEERKERESLISLSTSDSEFERRVTTDGYSTSVADLTAQTAGEMTASDELQQLRAEIAQLNDMNAELATKVSMLEVEKSSIEKTKDEAQKLLEELKLVGGALREKSDQSERLGACGDVGFDVSVEDAQSENVRLSEELRRNMHEIELARTHRAALEKELLELKALASSTLFILFTVGKRAEEGSFPIQQNQLQHQIDALEEQLKSQKEEIERLIQLVEAERGRAEEASDAVKQKEAEQEAMRVALMSDVNEKDSQVTRLEEEVKRVQSEEVLSGAFKHYSWFFSFKEWCRTVSQVKSIMARSVFLLTLRGNE
ncbi:unnamed protein product [Heligmosomoides polygyrus]|uniref:Myosin_tail_1 domain-containing protein n=1 Tax=Heligmosomoides polygyrus TaxID=6339 RepID=A0A183FZM9_HELPZ|nr:unnamed protein product [Heligmosomoides polygyrus]